MQTAWSIVKAVHATEALAGDGARMAGGRWNSSGIPLIYASATSSLAILEMLFHLGEVNALSRYVLVSCRFRSSLIERIEGSMLPPNWRAYPAPYELQRIGDAWIHRAESAILEVPSAIVEGENNFLLNPAHADFKSVTFGKPKADWLSVVGYQLSSGDNR